MFVLKKNIPKTLFAKWNRMRPSEFIRKGASIFNEQLKIMNE